MRLGVTGIDHVRIEVGDLEAARMAWTRLGFALAPRGTYLGGGTQEDAILCGRGGVRLMPWQREGDRPGSVMFAVPDIVAAEAAVRATGMPFATNREVARQFELPEESVLERFRILNLPEDSAWEAHNELWYRVPPVMPPRPEWLEHPNGVRTLVGVTVVVPDTAPLQERYEKLFGPANVHTTDKVISVRAGRQRMLVASRDDFAAMHPEVEPDETGRESFVALLTLDVGNLDKTTDYLANFQIEHEAPGTGRLVVPPSEANGVILEFVAERR
jgi:hypothetical protein